ncbi:hypothetical protein [Streptomyces sp. NPDC054958]
MADSPSWTVSQEVRVENGYGYGVIGADLQVYPDRGPVYLLTGHQGPRELVLSREEETGLPAQPSRVLNARYALLDFTGRQQDLERLGGGGSMQARLNPPLERRQVQAVRGPGSRL